MPEQPAGEKTLPASQRKRQQARERGNVAKSSDLNSSATLLFALLALWALGPSLMEDLVAITRHYFSEAHVINADTDNLQPIFGQVLMLTGTAVLPMMFLLLVGGILINVMQFGILFSGQALQPKLERINPISGFQRFFSMRSLVELAKSLLKLAIIGYIVWISLQVRWEELLSLTHMGLGEAMLVIWQITFQVWWRVILAMLLLGVLDYGFQYWQRERDLRMTQREAKEEMKQLEGDPQIRQRIRQIQRQMAMQRMMAEVPEADVIVTNPVTYAVAIRYAADEMGAPTVVAKGARLVAERIRNLAVENDVPIVERPDLARDLFRTLEVGNQVPERLFRAVAEVLAYVYQIDRREEKRRERGQATMPAAAAS